MVDKIKNGSWGFNTNFTAALNLILQAIVETKMRPEEAEGMILTVFSDMQIDANGNESLNESMFGLIKRRYARRRNATLG